MRILRNRLIGTITMKRRLILDLQIQPLPTYWQRLANNDMTGGPLFVVTTRFLLTLLLFWPPARGAAQTDRSSLGTELPLSDFRPESQLRVPKTNVQQARFWAVDVHTHFLFRQRHNRQALADFVELMDRNRIAICCSMDGKLGPDLQQHRQFLWAEHEDRFLIFAHLDWQGDGKADAPANWACNRPGFALRTAERLRQAHAEGVAGLKIFKGLGLEYRDADGRLLRVDDPRWDPIWKTCGELGIPVLMHTADPAAFFLPIDATNERWEELSRRPEWSFYNHAQDDDYPDRDALLAARNRVVARHPKTNFIGAHLAESGEDLQRLGQWLDRYPNLYVDFASRINELGRQPYTSRDFLIDHADRVLFGTDGPWPEIRIRYYWRFLETRDQYFPYSEKDFPPQGFWQIYGVYLPDDVLSKIYFENAARIIPGVASRLRNLGVTPLAD